MTIGKPNPGGAIAGFGQRLPLRGLAFLAVVIAAYHYSLLTLAGVLTLQTPLAYLALVPVIALVLGWFQLSRQGPTRPIHDRELDYILGMALVALAAGIALLLPITLATRFWMYRIDLLTLPLFVAGIVALLYGSRQLWALRFPIAFLFLAWPVLYFPLVGDGLQAFTDATVGALTLVSHVVPVARPLGGEGLFSISYGNGSFPLSVGSACAGVNSLVGFILVGTALAYVVRGPMLRRVAWLIAGLVLVWILNIVRIEAIFLVGSAYGQAVAIDVLHPVAGLIVFNFAVFVMLLAASKFGLTFGRVAPAPSTSEPSPVRRVRAALGLSLVLAISLGVVNAGYARFSPFVDATGTAQLQAFDIRHATLHGWSDAFVATFDQGKQFFGASSSWQRIQYTSGPSAALRAAAPIYLDVVTTEDVGTLDAYGLEACYLFHGYRIESIRPVDVGGGLAAQLIDYHNPKTATDWSALWWEWPYQENGKTWFERVVIFVANGPSVTYHGGVTDLPPAQALKFTSTDRFLAAMARDLVKTHLRKSA